MIDGSEEWKRKIIKHKFDDPYLQGIPNLFNYIFSDWLDSVNYYKRTLDRIDGKIQWTDEALKSLDIKAKAMPTILMQGLKEIDINY